MLETWNSPKAGNWIHTPGSEWSRSAGLNEYSFYRYALSSKNAPSDCLCRVRVDPLGTSDLFTEDNILRAWTTLRIIHPLLDSQFRHTKEGLKLKHTLLQRTDRARQTFLWRRTDDDWEVLRNEIMNGTRIITDSVLSQLRIYKTDTSSDIEIILISSHAISDGLSLVIVMNDLLRLLASPNNTDLLSTTDEELTAYVSSRLPSAMESQLPIRTRSPKQLWREALAYVLVDIKQRAKDRLNVVALVPTPGKVPITLQKVHEFSQHETELLKTACKRRGFTMGHLIYAASCAAHTELTRPQAGSVVSIGSPINARRFFSEARRSRTDELVLALAFLDITLPCISMETADHARNVSRLWSLTKLAKSSVHGTILDSMFPYFAHIQQEKKVASLIQGQQGLSESANPSKLRTTLSFGSSAIGDLDKLLHTRKLPFPVKDFSLAMRARSGESLMHSYTIHGKLRLSLVYDKNLGVSVMQRWIDRTSELMLMAIKDDLLKKKSQL